MTVAASQSGSHARRYELKISRYDRVSSMLLSLLILLGVAVFVMLILWLTSRIFLRQAAVPVELMELGTGEGPLSGGMDLEGPTDEEVGLETDLEEQTLEDTLAIVAGAVDAKAVLLDDPALSDQMKKGSGGGSRGDGRGIGIGSGPGGFGMARHWELRFIKGNTLETYARQLDFFGIELGVLMPGNKVIYAYNLSKAKPDTKTGSADQEQKYYLTWRSGGLQEADRELLTRAGVPTQGRLILKFLPRAVEIDLATKEKVSAGPKADRIRKTLFGIREEGSGYAFYVMEQLYR